MIRGLRAVSDFEYELQMATMNRKLAPDIETLIIMTGEEFFYIASNTVKEVALHGGDISKVVPAAVVDAVRKKMKK
jgi:pantetheine-phosphate adenylyltransferase